MSNVTSEVGRWLSWGYRQLPYLSSESKEVIIREIREMQPRSGAIFVRLAGLSGALAVGLGAYGAHAFKDHDARDKYIFDTANKYHVMHSIALLAVPLTRRPLLVGSLMLGGMTIFSGSCYLQALFGYDALRKVTPYGGMMLIVAWIAIAV